MPQSSLFIDLVDDFNQSVQNTVPAGMTLTYPDDDVTGYTPKQLANLLYLMRGNLAAGGEQIWSFQHDVAYVLKQNKPAGVTNAQISDLFELFNLRQYWVSKWPEGLWK